MVADVDFHNSQTIEAEEARVDWETIGYPLASKAEVADSQHDCTNFVKSNE